MTKKHIKNTQIASSCPICFVYLLIFLQSIFLYFCFFGYILATIRWISGNFVLRGTRAILLAKKRINASRKLLLPHAAINKDGTTRCTALINPIKRQPLVHSFFRHKTPSKCGQTTQIHMFEQHKKRENTAKT